jgi:hypothetical protein
MTNLGHLLIDRDDSVKRVTIAIVVTQAFNSKGRDSRGSVGPVQQSSVLECMLKKTIKG